MHESLIHLILFVVKTQQDYVYEWASRSDSYLGRLMDGYDLKNHGECSFCDSEASWRCLTCTGTPLFCCLCCRQEHRYNALHRIQYWVGNYFTDDWLYNLGVCIHLGHQGSECPKAMSGINSQHLLEGPVDDLYASPSCIRDVPDDGYSVTVGHVNGVHKIWIKSCHCNGREAEDLHLMESRLFPLSFKTVQSAFTFELLDDFRLDNLECKVAAYHYYKKLRRVTSPIFPDAVPV